jgi:hypothetical protein
MWNPSPASPGQSLLRREKPLPTRSHRSAYRRDAIHYKSHPASSPITRRAVCTVRVQRNMVKLTIGPYGPRASTHHLHPIRHVPRVRGQIASSLGRRSQVTKRLAPTITQQGDTHPERTPETHRDIHISVQAQSTIHNQATKVWIVEVRD